MKLLFYWHNKARVHERMMSKIKDLNLVNIWYLNAINEIKFQTALSVLNS